MTQDNTTPDNAKTIHRRQLSSNFTILPNELLQDSSLSYKARGLLASMLSRPDNWETHVGFIVEQGKEGREAIRSAMAELEQAGFLTYATRRKEGGLFAAHEWCWYDKRVLPGERTTRTGWNQPQDGKPSHGVEPQDGKPRDGKPSHGFPSPTKDLSDKGLTEQRTEGEPQPFALEANEPVEPKACPFSLLRIQWNTLCKSLPKVEDINGERKKHTQARWKLLPDFQAWLQLFRDMEASDYLTGRKPSTNPKFKDWKADFDFLVSPDGFDKIREGKYKNKLTTPRPQDHGNHILNDALKGKTSKPGDDSSGGALSSSGGALSSSESGGGGQEGGGASVPGWERIGKP